MKLPSNNKVLTSTVGSYPKPSYLYSKSDARTLIDSAGFLFLAEQEKIGHNEFDKLLDRASTDAISDQNKAGIDIITDGKERRGQYVMHILKGLDGIDFSNLEHVKYRGGVYERDVPTIIGPITYKRPIIIDDFL